MRILVVSDLHGDLNSVDRAYKIHRPNLILCCGDWGDPDQVAEPALRALLDSVPIYTTFGNHDPLEMLARLRNRDDSAVLLGQGEVHEIDGLRLAAIGGIWAKSHAKPHYVTDADVAAAAARIARPGRWISCSPTPARLDWPTSPFRPARRPAVLSRRIQGNFTAPSSLRPSPPGPGTHLERWSQGDQRRRHPGGFGCPGRLRCKEGGADAKLEHVPK